MNIIFKKYQGTGNDFVMIDATNQEIILTQEQIKYACDRRFGIGADGLIFLTKENDTFSMKYYNSDGNESTMCGNGGRCFVKFLFDSGYIKDNVEFSAIDGNHSGIVNKDLSVSIQLKNVDNILSNDDFTFLNTGSPHHVEIRDSIDSINVKKEGSKIRYSEIYPEGTNVNFIELINPKKIKVRTYERGVEDETFSCGTGVTAAAITTHFLKLSDENKIKVITKGGNLSVEFKNNNNQYTEVWLSGPAECVFDGKIEI